MAIKWIHGDFATGAINENNELPVGGNNDKSTVDVNAGDNSTISMSKRDLGSNWKSIVSEGVTLVAEVDTDEPWNSPNAVRTGGWVNKIDGRINDLITAQIVGYREYLAARICTPLASGGTDKPKTGVKFEAGTWQGLIALIVIDSFKPVQGSPAQPPTNLGTVFADTSGLGIQRATRLADAEKYTDILDDIRDNLSPNGNEYRFVLRWADASKTGMVWDVYIGNDTDGKINWAGTNTNIVLDAEDFAHLDFKLSLSSENLANRVVAQSKAGDDETNTGADYTVVSEGNGLPLFDTFWNPGQELDSAKLLEGAIARVKDLKTPKGTASYEVKGEVSYWKAKVGSKLTFSGGTDIDTSGYDIVVRCTGVNWNSFSKKISIDVMLPQARYPRLPSSKSKSDNPMFGGDYSGAGGGSGKPVGGGYQGGNYTGVGNNYKFDELEPPYIEGGAGALSNNNRIACSYNTTIAISSDGSLYSWGAGAQGALGTGGTQDSLKPVQIGLDTDWVSVYSLYQSVYALKKDNTLWGWGINAAGELGLNHSNKVLEPVQILDNVREVFIKSMLSVHVIKNDGTLWTAGSNSSYEAGIANDNASHSGFTQIGSKTNWVKIESSHEPTQQAADFIALDADGNIYQWGRTHPEGITKIDTPIKFKDIYATQSTDVSPANSYYAAISMDNILYTWGYGFHDNQGYRFGRTLPAAYSGGITEVYGFPMCSSTSFRPSDTIMVIKPDGTLWVFGYGSFASIIQNVVTPIQYDTLSGFDWKQKHFATSSMFDFFAILNGSLFGGGYNYSGELGIGTNSSTKPQFLELGLAYADWATVTTNQFRYAQYTMAIRNGKMNGTGLNDYGQLGMNNKSTTYSWFEQP